MSRLDVAEVDDRETRFAISQDATFLGARRDDPEEW